MTDQIVSDGGGAGNLQKLVRVLAVAAVLLLVGGVGLLRVLDARPIASPATVLPPIADPPEPFRVVGIRPVHPAAERGARSPRTLDLPALYDAAPGRQHGFPASVHGSLTWFPVAPGAAPVEVAVAMQDARILDLFEALGTAAGVQATVIVDPDHHQVQVQHHV